MGEQKKTTKIYFNEVAGEWFKRAYDPDGKFLTFPTGKVRQDITINEMKRLNVKKKVIDLGCGTGQVVIELLKNGYKTVGIDNAPSMIAEARQMLLNEFPAMDGSKVFHVKDVLNLDMEERFDVVTAMGLLEYLENDFAFFKTVKRLLNSGGYAFIECRNRLFNITSGNQCTLEEAHSGDLKKLISQLDRIQKYSPTSTKEIRKISMDLFSKNVGALINDSETKILSQDEIPIVKRYPSTLVRRQHTPEELEHVFKRVGLKLKYVIYYHCHPYLPRYEKLFPAIFNRIAFLMQPIGYTLFASTICSAFVAVIEN